MWTYYFQLVRKYITINFFHSLKRSQGFLSSVNSDQSRTFTCVQYSSNMFDVKISIIILLMGLMIFDVDARTSVRNRTDPYEIAGDWYVIAAINLRVGMIQPRCWKVTIRTHTRTSFTGTSIFYDENSGTRNGKQFNGTRSKEFIYPNVFDISVTGDDIGQRGLQISIYSGYIYNYSIWEWDVGAGKLFDSLIVSRKLRLSKTEMDALSKLYPKVSPIINLEGDSCLTVDPASRPTSIVPTDDPFKLKGVWYIAAYQASNRTLGRIRCWIVNIKTSSQSMYTGTSAFLKGRNRERMPVSFSATQFGNWTHLPKFHITLNGFAGRNIQIVPFESYIHRYSFWVSYGDKTLFEYLVASRNPILTDEEKQTLDTGSPGFEVINNTRSSFCLSRSVKIIVVRENSTNEDKSNVSEGPPIYEEEEEEEENTDEIDMFTRDEPSFARRPAMEIQLLFLSVLLCMHFLMPPQ